MRSARENRKTTDMETVSEREGVDIKSVVSGVGTGKIAIIPGRFGASPVAIGDGLRSKVLCNIGTSAQSPDMEVEIRKARIAVGRGASIICDQSVGPNVLQSRRRLIESVNVPIASVPLYQTVEEAYRKRGNPLEFEPQELVASFEQQVVQGVSAPGIHPMTRELNEYVGKSNRTMPIVSRGGAILSNWIDRTGNENPYIEQYDGILDICADNDVPLTFVCSCRSGCIADGFDEVQVFEWRLIRELIQKAQTRGVSCVVDGLGHMSMDQIPDAVETFKRICFGVPLGVMGPATTDRALGHEHVANAIGAALAMLHGANYCQACCRTEHLGLPEIQDIPDAIGAFVIATYAGDLGRNVGGIRELDLEMAEARKENLWGIQLSLALEKTGAKETFDRVGPKNKNGEGCSICGDLCPFVVKRFVEK